MSSTSKLTNLQHELLKIFQYDLKEDQLMEIKALLADYFVKRIDSEMDELWARNQWSHDTMEQWLTEHKRTPYTL